MRKAIFAVIVGLAAVTTLQAFAASDPQNAIKYRQSVMKAIGAHIGAIVSVVKGEVGFTGDVAAHARGIQEMSRLVPHLFPEGTDNFSEANTYARPEIWEERAKFDAAVKAFQAASANLVKVAEAGDPSAFGGGLKELGKACGGCHKPFRAEKN
jgi:cytochrome c556